MLISYNSEVIIGDSFEDSYKIFNVIMLDGGQKMSPLRSFKTNFPIFLLVIVSSNSLNLHGMALNKVQYTTVYVAKQALLKAPKFQNEHTGWTFMRDIYLNMFGFHGALGFDGRYGKIKKAVAGQVACLEKFLREFYLKNKLDSKLGAQADKTKDGKYPTAEQADLVEQVGKSKKPLKYIPNWSSSVLELEHSVSGSQIAKMKSAQLNAIVALKAQLKLEKLQRAKKILDISRPLALIDSQLKFMGSAEKYKLEQSDVAMVPRASIGCARYYYKQNGMLYNIGLAPVSHVRTMQFKFIVCPELKSAEVGIIKLAQDLDLTKYGLIKYSIVEQQTAIIELSWLIFLSTPTEDKIVMTYAAIRQVEVHAKKRNITNAQLYIPASCKAEISLLSQLGYEVIDSIIDAKNNYAVKGYLFQKSL